MLTGTFPSTIVAIRSLLLGNLSAILNHGDLTESLLHIWRLLLLSVILCELEQPERHVRAGGILSYCYTLQTSVQKDKHTYIQPFFPCRTISIRECLLGGNDDTMPK